MKIRAAVLEEFGKPLAVQEVDLAEPKDAEVLVRLVACGVCHTDLYTASGADAIHVSSGGPGNETPAGTFAVFRKELRSWSVPFQVWLPYASYFNQGIAFHEYPDVPPTPASHGCVRVPAPEAPGVYKFAKIDTPVIVI